MVALYSGGPTYPGCPLSGVISTTSFLFRFINEGLNLEDKEKSKEAIACYKKGALIYFVSNFIPWIYTIKYIKDIVFI